MKGVSENDYYDGLELRTRSVNQYEYLISVLYYWETISSEPHLFCVLFTVFYSLYA